MRGRKDTTCRVPVLWRLSESHRWCIVADISNGMSDERAGDEAAMDINRPIVLHLQDKEGFFSQFDRQELFSRAGIESGSEIKHYHITPRRHVPERPCTLPP